MKAIKAAKNVKNIQNRIHELEGHQLQLDRKFTFLRIVLELAGSLPSEYLDDCPDSQPI